MKRSDSLHRFNEHRSYEHRSNKLVTLFILLLVLAAGCGVKKDSPAPGCVEYWGIAPMMGGCDGTTAILDLKVEPVLDCLTVQINNCNGGVLELSNNCTEPLLLGGVEISSGEQNVSLDVLENRGDSYLLTKNYTNFSDYIPLQDEMITVLGTLGDRVIKVTFAKTKKLCQPIRVPDVSSALSFARPSPAPWRCFRRGSDQFLVALTFPGGAPGRVPAPFP